MSISRLGILCLRVSLIVSSCGLTRCSTRKVLDFFYLLILSVLVFYTRTPGLFFSFSLFRKAFKYLTIMESWWKAIKFPGIVGMFATYFSAWKGNETSWKELINMNGELFKKSFWLFNRNAIFSPICKCSTTDKRNVKEEDEKEKEKEAWLGDHLEKPTRHVSSKHLCDSVQCP